MCWVLASELGFLSSTRDADEYTVAFDDRVDAVVGGLGQLYGVIMVCGIVAAVCILAGIGISLIMSGSSQERSMAKGRLLAVFFGLGGMFLAATIISVVIGLAI